MEAHQLSDNVITDLTMIDEVQGSSFVEVDPTNESGCSVSGPAARHHF